MRESRILTEKQIEAERQRERKINEKRRKTKERWISNSGQKR